MPSEQSNLSIGISDTLLRKGYEQTQLFGNQRPLDYDSIYAACNVSHGESCLLILRAGISTCSLMAVL